MTYIQRKYCPNDCDFRSYYSHQAGSGYSDINVYRGIPYQHGTGIGRLFAKFALPIAKYLGRQLLKTGVEVGGDVLSDQPLKKSLKARAKERAKAVAKDTFMKAGQLLEGSGRRRRKRRVKRVVRKQKLKKVHKKLKKRTKRRRRTSKPGDIFG